MSYAVEWAHAVQFILTPTYTIVLPHILTGEQSLY